MRKILLKNLTLYLLFVLLLGALCFCQFANTMSCSAYAQHQASAFDDDEASSSQKEKVAVFIFGGAAGFTFASALSIGLWLTFRKKHGYFECFYPKDDDECDVPYYIKDDDDEMRY